MFDAQRFGWLGETRRIELHALLVREVADWSRDWWLEHASAAIDVYPLDEWQPAGEVVATWRVGAGALQLVPRSGDAALGGHLAAHKGDDASLLAGRIGKRALMDLASRLARRAKVSIQTDAVGDSQPAACHRLELGAYMATLSLGSYTLDLAIDRAVADLLAPPKVYEKAALADLAQAIGGEKVSLEVCIPLGTASLTQLDDLRVGEVLVGDALLSAPVKVCLDGAHPIAFAKLSESDSCRAVTLTHSI